MRNATPNNVVKTADVIVIGAGIAGISAAAELAQDMSVVVLEGEAQAGYHATGRSAAIFIRNYGNAAIRMLNAASAPFLEAPIGVSETSLLSPRGEMLIANECEVDALNAYLDAAEGMEILSPEQAVELMPILRSDSIAKAAIEWNAQDIDVDRMLAGYTRLLRTRGGEISLNMHVNSLTFANGSWEVEASGHRYFAPIVVNAAGAWATEIAKMAKASIIEITPLRRSAAIVPLQPGLDPTHWPLVASANESWYAKPEAGKLMVSPADEDPVAPHDAWADDMVLAEGLHRFEQAVTMPITRVEHSWAGLRSFAPDRTPVVGFDAQAAGFFWLAGQGGYGVQTAPALAQLTRRMCQNQAAKLDVDIISAMNPERFT